MADNTAAKLAAGRKMLKDFQKKKTVKQPTDDPQQKKDVETHFNNEINSYSMSSNNLEPELYHGQEVQLSNVSLNQSQISTVTPSSFFDKFSTDNSLPNQHNFPNTVENGLPLAAILFSAQDNVDNSTQRHTSFTNLETIPKNSLNVTNTIKSNDTEISENGEGSPDLKTAVEISKLQQQLQFHVKTVEFLVTEKNDLTSKLNENEKIIAELKANQEDLTGRLNISRHRASHLEMECNNFKQKNQQFDNHLSQMNQEMSNLKSAQDTYKKKLNDLDEELNETKTLMNDKVLENKSLLKKIEELSFQINSNELRFQQMMQGSHVEPHNPSLTEHCQNLEQTVNILRQQLSQLEIEKNQSSIQFQQYVQQLNNRIDSLNETDEELSRENKRLEIREENLVQQISALEKQLQGMQSQNIINNKLSEQPVDTSLLEKNSTLEEENVNIKAELQKVESSLQSALQELDHSRSHIEELTNSLHQIKSESPDVAKLNAAMESDRLAAQKATAQNSKMKLDLQHLEKAFEQMTNSKLELVELLQAEKNLTKTLTLKLVETEEQCKDIQTKLLAKDEEMIRLQATSSELQKEMLKQAQITDRLNHYEAQGQSSELLQSELQSAKNTIQVLLNENEKLKIMKQGDSNIQNTIVNDSEKLEQLEAENDHGQINSEENIVTIPTADAMNKLQEKFTLLMKEVADLSDEKQKLEHLVLQLQGETETICEYIALYQKQRGILKQRENERNAQLTVLSKEREIMKDQLDNLKSLIRQLTNNTLTNNDLSQNDNNSHNTKQIEDKIMNLLTEIKGNHLIEPNENCNGLESFHPCPWCSGKLINV